MAELLAELDWANLIALVTVLSGIAGTWALNRHNRKKLEAEARDNVAAQWLALASQLREAVKSQGEQIMAMREQAAAQDDRHRIQIGAIETRHETRLAALEAKLIEACAERDGERLKRIELERKVQELEIEIAALRREANRVRP